MTIIADVCNVKAFIGGHNGVFVCSCNIASFDTTPEYVKGIYEEDFVDEDLIQQMMLSKNPDTSLPTFVI